MKAIKTFAAKLLNKFLRLSHVCHYGIEWEVLNIHCDNAL